MKHTMEFSGTCWTGEEPCKLIISNSYNACVMDIKVADDYYSTNIVLDRDQRDELITFLLNRGGVFSEGSLDDILGTYAIGCAYFGNVLWRLRATDDPEVVAFREELAALHSKQMDLVGKITELINNKKVTG